MQMQQRQQQNLHHQQQQQQNQLYYREENQQHIQHQNAAISPKPSTSDILDVISQAQDLALNALINNREVSDDDDDDDSSDDDNEDNHNLVPSASGINESKSQKLEERQDFSNSSQSAFEKMQMMRTSVRNMEPSSSPLPNNIQTDFLLSQKPSSITNAVTKVSTQEVKKDATPISNSNVVPPPRSLQDQKKLDSFYPQPTGEQIQQPPPIKVSLLSQGQVSQEQKLQQLQEEQKRSKSPNRDRLSPGSPISLSSVESIQLLKRDSLSPPVSPGCVILPTFTLKPNHPNLQARPHAPIPHSMSPQKEHQQQHQQQFSVAVAEKVDAPKSEQAANSNKNSTEQMIQNAMKHTTSKMSAGVAAGTETALSAIAEMGQSTSQAYNNMTETVSNMTFDGLMGKVGIDKWKDVLPSSPTKQSEVTVNVAKMPAASSATQQKLDTIRPTAVATATAVATQPSIVHHAAMAALDQLPAGTTHPEKETIPTATALAKATETSIRAAKKVSQVLSARLSPASAASAGDETTDRDNYHSIPVGIQNLNSTSSMEFSTMRSSISRSFSGNTSPLSYDSQYPQLMNDPVKSPLNTNRIGKNSNGRNKIFFPEDSKRTSADSQLSLTLSNENIETTLPERMLSKSSKMHQDQDDDDSQRSEDFYAPDVPTVAQSASLHTQRSEEYYAPDVVPVVPYATDLSPVSPIIQSATSLASQRSEDFYAPSSRHIKSISPVAGNKSPKISAEIKSLSSASSNKQIPSPTSYGISSKASFQQSPAVVEYQGSLPQYRQRLPSVSPKESFQQPSSVVESQGSPPQYQQPFSAVSPKASFQQPPSASQYLRPLPSELLKISMDSNGDVASDIAYLPHMPPIDLNKKDVNMVVDNTVEEIMNTVNYEMGFKGSGVDADALYKSAIKNGEIVVPDVPLPSYMAYSGVGSSPVGGNDYNAKVNASPKLPSTTPAGIPNKIKPYEDVKFEKPSEDKWWENGKSSKEIDDIKRGFAPNIIVNVDNDEDSAVPIRNLAVPSFASDNSGEKNNGSPKKSKTKKNRHQIPDDETSRYSRNTAYTSQGDNTYDSDSSSAEWILTSDSEEDESSLDNDDVSIDSQRLQQLVEDTIEGESDMATLRRVIFGCNDSGRLAELVRAKAKVQAETDRRNRQERKKRRKEKEKKMKQERIRRKKEKRERKRIRKQNEMLEAEGKEMEKLRLEAKIKRDEDEKQRKSKAETERIKKEMQDKIEKAQKKSSWW